MTATASASAVGHVVPQCESDRSEDYPTLYHASSSVLSRTAHRHATTIRGSSSRVDTAVLSHRAGSVGGGVVSPPLPHNDRSITSDSHAANTHSVIQHTTPITTAASSSHITSTHMVNNNSSNSSAASPSAMQQRGTNGLQGVVTISGTITTTRPPPIHHTPSLTNTTTTTTRRSNTIAMSRQQQQQQSDVVQQRSMTSGWVRLPDGHYMEPYTTSLYDNDNNNTSSPFRGYGSNRSSSSGGHDSRNRRSTYSGLGLASVTAERGCVVCLHYRTEVRTTTNNNSNNASSGATRHTPLRRVFVRHMPLEAWNALKAQGQLRHVPQHSRTHNYSNGGFAGYSVYRSSRHHFMPSTEHLVLPRQTSTMPRSSTPHTTTTSNNSSERDNAGRLVSSEMTTASSAHESAGSRVRRAFSQLIARHTNSTLSRLSITTHSSHNSSTIASLLRRSSSRSSSPHPSSALRQAGHGAGRQADTHNRSIHHTNSDDRSETRRSVSYTNGAAAGTGLSEAARRMRSEALNNNNSEYYTTTTTTTNTNGEEEEPAVHDYVVLPGSRAQALRLFKHSSLLHYLQYKWMCSQQVQRLRRIEREDRRALLALERRQTFLRCLQRDEEGRRNGTLLYVVGRELPQEMVQLFFLLNEQFVPRRRQQQRQQEEEQRRQESLTTMTTTTPSSTTTTTTGEEGGRNRNNETRSEQDVQQRQQHHRRLNEDSQRTHSDFFALDALNTRWGDRLLFAGLRPVEGYVVVTVSEANMNRTADCNNSGSIHAVEEEDVESSSSSSSSEDEEYDNGRVTRARRGGGGVWETYAYTPRPDTEKDQHIS